MPSFEESLNRMKSLYTYGREVNESNNLKTHTLEHRAVAADGVTYGIIRENSKYYIKSAPKGKETIAEAYDYLGGFCNKGNYEYTSYANALKQFELKLASINEAHDQKVNIESLNPFRANAVLAEATDAMRDEIARQRQIMYNVSMLMNESTEIGADRKDDVVKFDGKNPEAETGKRGDESNSETKANPEYEGSKTKGVEKKVTPFDQGEGSPKDQLKEEATDIGDAPLHPNTSNWGTEGIGKGEEPETIGWDIEGQKKVNEVLKPEDIWGDGTPEGKNYRLDKNGNPVQPSQSLEEEENEWASKGLPSTPGVGEADTDHNDNPFNKSINEEEDFEKPEEDGDEEEPEFGGEDIEGDDADLATDTDFDAGVNDVDDEEGMGDEEDSLDSALDSDDEGDMEEPELGDEDENSDILAQIEALQSQLDALRAQVSGEDTESDLDTDLEDDDFNVEDEPTGDIAGNEPDIEGDAESFSDNDDFGTEDGEEDFSDDEDSLETSPEEEPDGEFGGEGEDTFDDDDDLEECFEDNSLYEAKQKVMNKIVESVVGQILKEDELHVFGKHPGYRKKPMELPTTGQDKNQWGEDWNDESVHSEEPFGQQIGDGTPFNKLVDAVTKDVMYQLKAGVPIEGEDKKKE